VKFFLQETKNPFPFLLAMDLLRKFSLRHFHMFKENKASRKE
jgi:hypothetical protein